MRILEEALTFDDVLLVPAYSEILPREVDLSTRVTRRIRLNVPLLSAAMDTVTEARLAITIAQEGGVGIIHKSMSIEAQAREVARVKKFESGVIKDPITVSPNMSIREVLDLTRARGISGVPVVVGRKAVGIVTHRDLRFEDRLEAPVSEVMTPRERLVTVREEAPKDEVLALLHRQHLIRFEPTRTNGEYVRQVRLSDQAPPEMHEAFERLTHHFEMAWYGECLCESDDYRACRSLADEVQQLAGAAR